MKIKILFVSTLLTTLIIVGCKEGDAPAVGAAGGSAAEASIEETSIGIGADAVFNDPSPSTFTYPTTKVGKSDRLARSYEAAPPMVSHTVEEYLPITMETNDCLDCHDRPTLREREYVKGKKLAMTVSHYGGFYGKGDLEEVSGARYNCTLCHAPVSDAKPLVENIF